MKEMKRQFWYVSIVVVVMILWMTACGQSSKETTEVSTPSEPSTNTVPTPTTTPAPPVDEYTGGKVELSLYDRNTGITEEEFQQFFVEPLQKKYKDISMVLIKNISLADQIAAGTPPDMVAVSNTALNEMIMVEYPEDLNAMIKRFNLDINRFEKSITEVIQGLSGNGRMYGLPFGLNYGTTFINVDIFNKFGVDLPPDHFTWDDVYEYARRMTVEQDGTQFIGAAPANFLNMLRQHGTSNMDDKDENAVLTSAGHQEVYTFIKKFLDIPGFIIKGNYLHNGMNNVASGSIGMSPDWISSISNWVLNGIDFEWDIRAFPVYKDRPQYGNAVDFHMLVVNQSGKNKEAAYRVLLSMTSDEVQKELTRHKRITPLINPEIRGLFHEATGIFEGKNLQSVFTVEPASLPDYSRWKSTTDGFANKVVAEMASSGKDLNTILREQEELANAKLKEVRELSK